MKNKGARAVTHDNTSSLLLSPESYKKSQLKKYEKLVL